MSEDRYNGYANRETWTVALFVDNDEGWLESVLEALREAGPDVTPAEAGQIVRENVESLITSSGYRDTYGETIPEHLAQIAEEVGSLWRVDWDELGEAYLEQLGEIDNWNRSQS